MLPARSAHLWQCAVASLWLTHTRLPGQHQVGGGERGHPAECSCRLWSHTGECVGVLLLGQGYMRHISHSTTAAQTGSGSASRCMGCGCCVYTAGLMEQGMGVCHLHTHPSHGCSCPAMGIRRQGRGCAAVGRGPATHAVGQFDVLPLADCTCTSGVEHGQRAMLHATLYM